MAGIRLSNIHYGWEYCISMALGALILLTSWMTDDAGNHTVAINAVIMGILVLALGASEVVDWGRWEEALETACELWLSAPPFIFGYAYAGSDICTSCLALLLCY